MLTVDAWWDLVQQMIRHFEGRRAEYFVMRFTPDEAEAAEEVFLDRYGYCPQIYTI